MNSRQGAPLWQWSACDLAGAIRAGEVSAMEALGSVLKRVESTNGRLNAIVDDMSVDAEKTAAALDSQFGRIGPVGPLHGVPVTIKVNIDVEGHANTNGVTGFKDMIAPDDSPVTAQLRAAGAVVIGLTNTPEFSFRATTVNEVHGRTINPWDDTRSPGGSSGGASSAVAAGFGPIAHGNDIGGSLRFPSFCCGAVTVKPGQGRVAAYNPSAPAERSMIAQLMSTQGVIAREVRDVRFAMQVLTDADPRDPWQTAKPLIGPPVDPPIKVAVARATNGYPIEPEITAAVDKAVGILADAGYRVEEVDPPMLEEIAKDALATLFGDAMIFMEPMVREYGSGTFQDIFDNYRQIYGPYDPAETLRAMARRTGYVRAWNMFLEEYPLILSPFLMRSTYEWDEDERGVDAVRGIMDSGVYSWTMNFLGLPAAIAPAGFVNDLPISIQIIGRKYREDLCLDAAEAIERVNGIQIHELWRRQGERL